MSEIVDEPRARYPRVVRFVSETPWAILPGTFAVIRDLLAYRAAGGRLTAEEIEERIGVAAAAQKASTITQGSVAVIPLRGVIVPHADMFSEISGGASIDGFLEAFREAVAEPNIGAVLLDIDSPGGSTDLLPEAAAEIRAGRAKKPIVAVANTDCFSAAYWLASQADEVVVTPSGGVGSVGVFAAHEDMSQLEQMAGVKTTLISAGKYKVEGNPFEPLTDEARAAIQQRVDDMYGMFVSDVAKGRGVSEQDVRDGFGEGRPVLAAQAVREGMADRVAPFGQTLQKLVRGQLPPSRRSRAELGEWQIAEKPTRNVVVDVAFDGSAVASGVLLQANQLSGGTSTARRELTAGATRAAAVPAHSTAVVDEPWDGPGEEAKLPTPITGATGRGMYAWYDSNGNDPDGDGYPDAKADWKFPHHQVTNGRPGAANVNGVRNALSRLPQAQIPEGDRAAVEAHLQRHLDDFKQSSARAQPTSNTRKEKEMATIAELLQEREGLARRVDEINAMYVGELMPTDADDEFRRTFARITEIDEIVKDDERRREIVRQAVDGGSATEKPARDTTTRRSNGVGGSRVKVPAGLFNLAEYRRDNDHEDLPAAYREGAKRALEMVSFPHPDAKRSEVLEHISKLLDTTDLESGSLAYRILATGSPAYVRAFGKYLQGSPLNHEESQALSMSAALSETGAQGGYAVPFILDPTVIPTSSGAINPIRRLASVETITAANEWRGVTSAGVTAHYRAEGAEVADDAPTLGQPTIHPERADVFIPFSIELGQDWGSLQSEMARLIQDAKDVLEATKFITGLGHASNEPQGLLVGATRVVLTASTAAFVRGDLDTLEAALPPRYRPRASIIGSKSTFQKVRLFAAAGDQSAYNRLDASLPPMLVGYSAYEDSVMDGGAIASGQSILTIGDFSYYKIIDRVGLSIEVVPHLFGSNQRPTGQRGLFAFWRNSAGVLDNSAFETLKVR